MKADYLINNLGLKVDEIWVIVDISDLQNEIAYENFIPQKQTFKSKIIDRFSRFSKNHSFVIYALSDIIKNREIDKFQQTLRGFNEEVDALPNPNAIELYKDFFNHFDDESMLQNPDFHGVGEWIYDPSLRKLADKGLENGFENIALLKQICNENNILLRLSVHPWQTQVVKGDTTDYYVEKWRKFCDRENICFINLFPVFINHENPHYVNKVCYIEGDNHWNETGNQRVAAYLSVFLD
ncbi:MAG: hypothetical protein ACLFQS_03165 [Bacteroidales bacterium]